MIDASPPPGTTKRGLRWLWVMPRFDETLRPEFWRYTGKMRFIALILMLISTLAAALGAERMHFEPQAWWRLFWFLMPLHCLDLLAGLWIWQGRLSPQGMRRVTIGCLVIEAVTTMATAWTFGSVSSHLVAFPLLVVLIYRLAFDFRLGVTAYLLLLIGQWAVVIAETTGWLTAQPIAREGADWLYRQPERELNTMFLHTVALTITLVLANWAVARMRHKEITIRQLREQLEATAAGKLGRHSGRTLADTYLVGALLGSGGMGEVYRGRHQRTGRSLAIKLLHPHLIDNPEVLARFRREAETIGRLGSEHIVEIIDVGEDDDQPFLVLAYLEGATLGAQIAAGPLALDQLAEVFRQLARGVEVAHRAGVVHRDLKPENVYLCRRDDGSPLIKILDFGISKIRDHATAITHEFALLGTPAYMSPEQAVGLGDDIAELSDLFSLGSIAYAAITGRAPFAAASMPALLRQICDEEPVPIAELRPDAPAAVAAVVAIAMAKRADERYRSATELAADLSAAIAGTLSPAVLERAARLHRGRPAGRDARGRDLVGDLTVADTTT